MMRYRYFIAIAVVVPSLIGLFQYFRPDAELQPSRQTTFLTTPLAEDGLPNYALAIIERQRRGVASKDNAAPLLWRAAGPGELDPASFAAICTELGIEDEQLSGHTPLIDISSDSTRERLVRWIAQQDGSTEVIASDEEPLPFEQLDSVDAYINSVQSHPWQSEEFPPLAAWLSENETALNLLVEASQKPILFSPSANALIDPETPVIDLSLEHAEQVRKAVRSLAARAMHRLGQGDLDDAWQDVLACWRFGELVGDDRTLVEILVGIAARNVAANATLAILGAENLPETTARQIVKDLNGLRERFDLASSIDFSERLIFLDSTLRHLSGRLGGIENQALTTPQETAAIDLNIILERGNLNYDQLVDAISIKDWQKRAAAIAEIDAEFEQRSQSLKSRMFFSIFSRSKRSEAIADILILLMVPATNAAVDAWERDQATLALTKTAATLALYRIQHGEYPESLGELPMPRAISNDPYTASPQIYERRGEGYLLYSLSKNRIDDGGHDLSRPIVDGEWIPNDEFVRPAQDACDLVIRLPLPPLELPAQPAAEDAKP